MANNYPKMWQNIKLIRTRINGEQDEYASKIVDIQKNDVFVVETPLKKMQLVMLMNGSRLNMIYTLENIGIFSCDIEVIEKIRDGGIPLVRVKKVSEIKRIQRRNYFRLDYSMDVVIRKQDDIIVEKTKTIDISGGGMKIASKQKFEIGDILKISFMIAANEYNYDSKIVKINDEDREKTEVSVQFLEVPEKERNEIIKFVFDKQREGLKKGIISNG